MTITAKQGDSAPNIEYRLTQGGDPVDLSNATEVQFVAFNIFEEKVIDANTSSGVSIEDTSSGLVQYDLSSSDTNVIGEYDVEWTVTFSDGEIISFPNSGFLEMVVNE